MSTRHNTAIIGAGPAGLTALACLIDNGETDIAWIDPKFRAGRVGERYREVPSNTKVSFFIAYIKASPFLTKVAEEAQKPNAYTILQDMTQDKGCTLGYAADLILFFSDEIIQRHKKIVHVYKGTASKLNYIKEQWHISYSTSEAATNTEKSFSVGRIVRATGSEPIVPNEAPVPLLDMDLALTPSLLARHINKTSLKRIAVIGSSHSAILALKNITDISSDIEVLHFYRSPLKFAEYKDGWILYDNTGLKGLAADWAKSEYHQLSQIRKILLPGTPDEERSLYITELTPGTEAVYAIGFRPISCIIEHEGISKNPVFDALSGKFNASRLYGCGIAFPELVTDPAGNVEYAVGFYKFMKFVKRVSADWL